MYITKHGAAAYDERELRRSMKKTQSSSEGRPPPRRPARPVVTSKRKLRQLEMSHPSDDEGVQLPSEVPRTPVKVRKYQMVVRSHSGLFYE